MNLRTANELVLRVIGEAGDQMILGFLPLSREQEEEVLTLVRHDLDRPGASINGLLRIAPAATGYALAVAPSRTLTTGGEFWPALKLDLGLQIEVNQRAAFAAKFRSLCRKLGLLAGTIEDAFWVHAAPFIYQSGILHFWTDSLATSLRSVLRRIPAPDLEDTGALQRFAGQLTNRISTTSPSSAKSYAPILVRSWFAA